MLLLKKAALVLLIFTLSSYSALKIGEVSNSRSTVNNLKELHGDAFLSSVNVSINRSSVFSLIELEDTILVPITSNKSMIVVKTKLKKTLNGGLLWKGEVIGNEDGYCDLFIRNNLITGSIYLNDIVYKIDALSSNSIRIVTLDPDAREEDFHACGVDSPREEKEEVRQVNNRNDRALVYVDLLILYPQQIESNMGGAVAMENEVLYRIEKANEAFENSLMNTRFRLAHHQVISSSDIPAAATSANDVKGSSLAVSLRKQYKADLVSHWNYGGTAGSGNNYNGSYSYAYNTSNFSDVQTRYTFVHECGHNLGAKHDRYTYIEQGREDELEDYYYKYGYLIDYGSNSARTIMAYDQCADVGIGGSCTRVPYFSNPNVTYQGAATGVNPPSSAAAYNALRIDECSPTVSEFEDGNPVITYTLTVNSGFGDGDYEEGAIVTIIADEPGAGKLFDKWSGDVSSISNVNNSTTTIKIGTSNIEVTALYKNEVIDTTDASPNLVGIAGWEADHDSFGNSSVDTGNAIIVNDVVTANFTIGASNATDKIWPHGSVTAYLDPATNLTELKYIKVIYNSNKPVNVSLPQPPLAEDGISYMFQIPASSSDTTVLLDVSKFDQPDWIEASQEADIDLSVVKAISFEMTADNSDQSIEISEVILYGYDLPVSNFDNSFSINNKLSLGGVTSENINITVPFDGAYTFEIFTADGKLIKKINNVQLKRGIRNITWNGFSLASKLYFMAVEGPGLKITEKIIIKGSQF